MTLPRSAFRFGVRLVYGAVSLVFIQRPTRRVLGDRHWFPRR